MKHKALSRKQGEGGPIWMLLGELAGCFNNAIRAAKVVIKNNDRSINESRLQIPQCIHCRFVDIEVYVGKRNIFYFNIGRAFWKIASHPTDISPLMTPMRFDKVKTCITETLSGEEMIQLWIHW